MDQFGKTDPLIAVVAETITRATGQNAEAVAVHVVATIEQECMERHEGRAWLLDLYRRCYGMEGGE